MSNSAQDPNAMEDTQSTTVSHAPEGFDKGKGKAAANPDAMEEDDDDEEDDEDNEGEVEEPEEDNLEEIDTDNIVGQRTRGKNIDYAEAARRLGDDEDEDDEDDEDFEDDEMVDE